MLVLVSVQTYLQMRQPQIVEEKRVRLERYMDGTAEKPFVFRQLVPLTVRALDQVTPASVAQGIRAWGDAMGHYLLPNRFPQDADPLNYYFLAGIMWLSLLGFALVGRRVYLQLFPTAQDHGWTAAGLLLFNLLLCTHRVGHIYDFTVLLMMMSLVAAIAYQRHGLYLLLFAISCVNKETTALAMVMYAACFAGRVRWRFLALHLAAQVAIFLAVYGTLRHVFADNIGQGMDCWFSLHVKWLLGRGIPFYLGLAVLGFLLGFRWSEKPSILRRGVWMVVANVVLFVAGGFPAEWRNFYETTPLLTLLFFRNIELLLEPVRRRITPTTTVANEGHLHQPTVPSELAPRGERV